MGIVLDHRNRSQRYARKAFMAYFSREIMELILPFSPKRPARQIGLKQPVLMIGSCFAEEIGAKMDERRFDTITNPHGILYDPISLGVSLKDCLSAKQYSGKDLHKNNELWYSFSHHGRFSNVSETKCLQHINGEITKAHEQLKKAQWLIITFGSAFVYKHKNSDRFVGNCHKLPAAEFEKVLLGKEQIVADWKIQIEALRKFNPQINILFTVSPVRYVRDGLVENNRSKGILLDTVHTLTEQHANCLYFPAYEIVIDVLRDHRFYKEDLVHPNQLAINYVWDKFVSTCCDEGTQKFLEEYEPVLKGLQHRPINENTEAHQKFRIGLQEKIKALEEKYL